MTVLELLEVLLLFGCGQFLNIGDGGRVWGFVGADEHLRYVPRLVEGLVLQRLVALHHCGQVHQLGERGRGWGGERQGLGGREAGVGGREAGVGGERGRRWGERGRGWGGERQGLGGLGVRVVEVSQTCVYTCRGVSRVGFEPTQTRSFFFEK